MLSKLGKRQLGGGSEMLLQKRAGAVRVAGQDGIARRRSNPLERFASERIGVFALHAAFRALRRKPMEPVEGNGYSSTIPKHFTAPKRQGHHHETA